jgi:CMP/dCMP kinase
VTQRVSEVSAHPAVRHALVAIQREFGEGKNAVFEGRDMGTVVFPKADFKFFLTARPAVRAERRYLEFKQKKMPTTSEEVLQALLERDHFDSTREISPLKQAEDAHLIDTSDITIEEVIDQILVRIKKNKS